jgi:aminopeptidase N
MRKIGVILLLSAISLVTQVTLAQKVDVYQRPVQVERSREFDALHYKISLVVDPAAKSLSGTNEITLVPLNNGLKRCTLDAEYLVVSKVVDQQGKSLHFEQVGNQVLIDLNSSYNHTDTLKITVSYSLDKPTLGLRFIDPSPTNPRLVSSDCFPNKARQWIPCYDYPNDKVTTEMIVTVGQEYKVLSNGRLVGVTENQAKNPGDSQTGARTWHWSQDLPHSTYLINLSIGNYEVLKDSLNSLPVNYWVYSWHKEDARRSFSKSPHMIDFFNKLYMFPYPWAKYDQVITPYMGGGAEATTATLLGEGAVMDGNAEQDFSWERVIAHEIAHQWWGDIITLRSWEHTWLNESFATYSDYLYTRNEYGEDAGAYDLLGKKNQYLNEARTRYIRPIVFNRYNEPGENFDSHTYPKGANVLHLLRYLLGDDTFFRVLSTFLHENQFKPVDTHDFMKTVKEVSGQNMDWFFDQYIFSPGHLIVEVTKNWDKSGKVLTVNVLQKQDSLPGVPVYTVPVNLGFTFADGKVVKEVWLKKKSETFQFAFDAEPLLVRFDEGNYLLKECTFRKSLQELVYQAGHDDVIGRLSACEELRAFGNDPAAIEAWVSRASQDSFWAVRQAGLVSLGRFAAKDHLELFKKAALDENSRVRQTAVRILGDQKDPSLARFFRKVYETDNSYAVQAEALRSIGKCGSKKDVPFLTRAAERVTYRNVVEKAAKEALKNFD